MIVMLPRVEARDSLLWAARLGVGTGAVKASDRTAALRAWRKQAGAADSTSARTPRGLMAALAAAGVPVHVVKRKGVTAAPRPRAKSA